MNQAAEKLIAALPKNAARLFTESLCTVAALPGTEHWKPNPVDLFDLMWIAGWGWILNFVKGAAGMDDLLLKIGSEIVRAKRPRQEDLAEVTALAIAAHLGVNKAVKVPEATTNRTPDFQVTTFDGHFFEIEVTCAARKREHLLLNNVAGNLVGSLHDKTREWDVDVWLAKPLDPMPAELLEAAHKLRPGQQTESVGSWLVRAKTINRPPKAIFAAGEPMDRPSWWPVNAVTMFALRTFVAGPDDLRSPPQTQLKVQAPISTYFNSIEHKATRPQSDRSDPYLIAIDVTNLYGALAIFRRGLPEYFPTWRSISGVLFFEGPSITLDHIALKFDLVRNPHAFCPLPESFAKELSQNNGPAELSGYLFQG